MSRLFIVACFLPLACAAAQELESPRFEQVGVIEGFYGPPWSHEDRLDILEFMGRVGLTHYYYAPKDDPFHRARWREPYPESGHRALKQLAAAAAANAVTFVYSISPGGSMVYADSSDYDQLLGKLDAILALGVRDIALMLDDVPPVLQHPADREAFESLAAAHAAVINRLLTDLANRGASLAVTPTTYTDAWGDRTYLRELATLVPDTVPFFWTGIDVAAPDVTVEQAAAWSELIGRQPLVWDNFPVNDFARWRLFLGPLRDRSRDLPRGVRGLIANPMNEAHASMIPLATLAIYAHAPEEYDPEEALATALDTLYGSAASLVRPFIGAYGDYAFDRNVFEPLFIPANQFAVGRIEQQLNALATALRSLDSTARAHPELRGLADDLRPFVNRTTARLAQFLADPAWVREGDSLMYRPEHEGLRLHRAQASVRVDGNTEEWSASAWHALGDGDVAQYAATTQADTLYMAIVVSSGAGTAETGDNIASGDHIAVVVQADMDRDRQYLTAEDMLLLVSPDETMIRHMPFHGFMAKYLADNANLRWSEFLLSTFAVPVGRSGWRTATRRRPTGWAAEIAVPLEGRSALRMSVTATTVTADGRRTAALAARNYPANPATYVEVRAVP